MNLHDAEKLARSLMNKHGLDHWKFGWNNLKSKFGICKYGSETIELSTFMTEHGDVEQVTNTILHEIAHAIVGHKHGHDRVWRRKAQEIGCNGQRCGKVPESVKADAKYLVACTNCGKEYPFHRKPSNDYESARFSHKCGKGQRGKFKLIINK